MSQKPDTVSDTSLRRNKIEMRTELFQQKVFFFPTIMAKKNKKKGGGEPREYTRQQLRVKISQARFYIFTTRLRYWAIFEPPHFTTYFYRFFLEAYQQQVPGFKNKFPFPVVSFVS